MKSNKIFLPLILFFFLFTSCGKGGKILTSITGSAYEILVVMPKKYWKTDSGTALFSLLSKDMIGMPQAEPTLSISKCSPEEFNSLLKPTRNIIIVDIDSTQYTQAKIMLIKDKWSSPQSIARITAPNQESFVELIKKQGDEINNYFVQAEISRTTNVMKNNVNKELMKIVYDQFNISMQIPSSITMYKQEENALWLSSGTTDVRQDIIIYSYPYYSEKQLELDSLLKKRDEIICPLIPGPAEGSCMGTERIYDIPQLKKISKNGRYCAEIRGLWKVYGDAMMGGPFISHTAIDEIHQRIITIEGCIYAPQQKKRTAIRTLEAAILTAQLPTMMEEITIDN